MRYRILGILAVPMALIGLSAPAALASPSPSPLNGYRIEATSGPFNMITNVNQSVGLSYPGAGNQAIVSTSPGNSYFEAADGADIAVIHNSNGHCLRMRNAANGYAVMAETGCTTSDNNERFLTLQSVNNPNLWAFQNIGTGEFLGVSCSAGNGSKVFGVSGNTGTCYNWLLQ